MASRAHLNPSLWVGGACAAFVLGAAAAASAQPAPATAPTTVEELTITARYGPGNELRSLSQKVNYADLDLTTDAGRNELSSRIKATAHDLCVRLGEDPHLQTPPVPSCEQSAISSTSQQQRMAIASAQPRQVAPSQPAPAAVAEAAPAAEAAAVPAAATVTMTTNGPVPDTPENRKKYGGPNSRAGRRTAANGN